MKRNLLIPTACLLALVAMILITRAAQKPEPSAQAQLPPRAEVPLLPPPTVAAAQPGRSESPPTDNGDEDSEPRPDLVLLATTVSPSLPERSRAHVHDRTSLSRHVLAPGQQILGYDNLQLVEIDDGWVAFDYDGERLELTMDPELSWPEDPNLRPAPVKLSELVSLMGPQQDWESDEEMLARFEYGLGKLYRKDLGLRSNKALFEQGVFAPKKVDGQQVGYYASRINKGSFWDTLGLESGDIILEVNGIPIAGPESNRDAVKEVMRSDTKIQLLIERGEELFETRTATLPVANGLWSEETPVENDMLGG